jgi:hypothetical protein
VPLSKQLRKNFGTDMDKMKEHSEIIIIMALQPFVAPWPLFQFINLYTVGRTLWTRDQPVARPLSTHRTTQTQNKSIRTSMR